MPFDDGSGFTPFIVDASADVGQYADLAIDASDMVHVSYYDADAYPDATEQQRRLMVPPSIGGREETFQD